MSTSEKDDASLPRSEMMNQVSEISPLGSKWTARDIEELPSATKLCTSCLRLVDFLERYFLKFCTTKTKGEAWSFTQHASHKSLKRSKTLGCHICPIIYADWIDKDSTLLEGYDKFGSRLQSATYEPFAEFSLETYAENPQGRIRSGTWILKVTEFTQIKDFLLPCSRIGDRLEIIHYWADQCLTKHSDCGHYRGQWHLKPSRLLYLDPKLPDLVRLVTLKNEQDYIYVTLSHRWGAHPLPEPPKMSTKQTAENDGWFSMEELRAGIPQSTLPKTFRDAMQISRCCKVTYIWIDSLCIIQDKNNRGNNSDWDREAVKMGDIYAGALFSAIREYSCNIAAVEAQHSDQGLLPTGRENLILALPRYQMTGGGMPLILYRFPLQVFNGDVTGSGLLSRGWVFQEILLSPANLFCTKDQFWWSCERASHSETLPAHPPNMQQPVNHLSSVFTDGIRGTKHWLQARGGATEPVQSWTEVLRMYSRTSVTYKDDRMVALQGISELFRPLHFEKLGDTEYHSGLWSVDVLQQLLWSKSGHVGEAYTASPQAMPLARPIPTWSALKDPKEVSYQVLGPGPTCGDWIMLPNRFVSMSTAHLDRFGRAAELTSCQMHLQGVLISIDFPEVPEPEGRNWEECVAYPTGHEDVPMTIVWDNYEEQRLAGASLSAVQPLTEYRALSIGVVVPDKNLDISGLLLRSVTDKEDPRHRSGTCLWMRCAFFHRTFIYDEVYRERDRCGRAASAAIDPARVHQIELAFQLNQRYGLSWKFENATEDTTGEGRWQQVSLHDADLEDIYIV